MNITIRCADCGRAMGTQVILGKNRDVTIERHACKHGQLWGKESDKHCTEVKPEPGEFTTQMREEYPCKCTEDEQCGEDFRKCLTELDRLQAVLSFTKQELGAANAELKDLKEMKLWKPENLQSKP